MSSGTWTIRASAGSNSRQVTLTILPQPTLAVTKPSEAGGANDFASDLIGDPWDMRNVEDISRWGTTWAVLHPTYDSTGMKGSFLYPGAPTAVLMDEFHVAGNPVIDSTYYRHLTFTLEYEGAQDKHWHNPYGPGMQWDYGVARVLFRPKGKEAWTSSEVNTCFLCVSWSVILLHVHLNISSACVVC